jgi:hypothetical protein
MRLLYSCLIALAMTAPLRAQTTAPAAPSLTAGAEFKGLRLDWEPVAGASRYQLEYRAHQTGPFVKKGSDYPASVTVARFRLPLHLFDWTYARYRVAACNSAGCTRSPAVSVSALRRYAPGYFKAAEFSYTTGLGDDTDISPDGLNFVAAAPGDSTGSSGAAYVFGRRSDGTWVQRARLAPPRPPFVEGSNVIKVAISADGNTVAVGMPNYFHTEFDANSGEVFVFRFNGTSWVRSRLAAGSRGEFGSWVGINDAGDTLAVANGLSFNQPEPYGVAIYKFMSGVWQSVRLIATPKGQQVGCSNRGVLSRDGSAVALDCGAPPTATSPARRFIRVYSGPNWTERDDLPMQMSVSSQYGYGTRGGLAIDATGDTVAAQIYLIDGPFGEAGPSQVHVFKRAAGVYSKVAELSPGAWRADQKQFYGLSIAVSGDGSTIAVGDSWDNGAGTGPRAAPLNPDPSGARTGAIYIYRLADSWRLANMVKPNNNPSGPNTFGHEVALNCNGHTLIVGHSNDGSHATGIGGDWSNTEGGGGAVWMY